MHYRISSPPEYLRKSRWPATLFYPSRYFAATFPRGHLLRDASIVVLKVATRISPGLPASVSEVRPLDMPEIAFSPGDSMVMEAVYWFGVRGYEGIMSEVWKSLCAKSQNVLEIGANVGLFSVIGGRVIRIPSVPPRDGPAVSRASGEGNTRRSRAPR